jgi:arylsulfatase A-like enzyme
MIIKYLTFPFLFLLSAHCLAQVTEEMVLQGEKQNLLFIITDQQQYKALSMAGNTVLETPNLDRLAREGAYFENAYTPSPVCVPARSSILTGHTVENTGMKSNNRAYYFKEEGLMTMPTFDEILAGEGYHTEYYGKWHSQSSHSNVYRNPKRKAKNGKSVFGPGGQRYVYMDYIHEQFPRRKLNPGELYDIFTERPYRLNSLDSWYGKNHDDLTQENSIRIQPDLHGETTIPNEYSITAFQARETINAIERLKDKQFSITCSFHFPHAPMLVPFPYSGMYPAKDMLIPESIKDDMENSPYSKSNGRVQMPEYSDPEKIIYMISNYYGLIKEIDDWVGKILDKLDELELADNTLVIFTSDHGEMLGAHGMREKNVFYEESSHIPLLIRYPGKIESNTIVAGYVSLVDLFPTILDYLKIKEHPSDGTSLRGLIEKTDLDHGNYVVTEWDFRGDVDPNYMIVKDGWKLIIPYSKSSKVINAMYNLNEDPHEMNNLLGINPNQARFEGQAEELRGYLLEWLARNNSKHYNEVRERELVRG